MAVLETATDPTIVVRVSRLLNTALAVASAVVAVFATAYWFASDVPAYAVLATACGVVFLGTAVADFGFRTFRRWARAATCLAWLASWPVLFVVFTLMLVDGAAAALAFTTCLGSSAIGVTAAGAAARAPR